MRSYIAVSFCFEKVHVCLRYVLELHNTHEPVGHCNSELEVCSERGKKGDGCRVQAKGVCNGVCDGVCDGVVSFPHHGR